MPTLPACLPLVGGTPGRTYCVRCLSQVGSTEHALWSNLKASQASSQYGSEENVSKRDPVSQGQEERNDHETYRDSPIAMAESDYSHIRGWAARGAQRAQQVGAGTGDDQGDQGGELDVVSLGLFPAARHGSQASGALVHDEGSQPSGSAVPSWDPKTLNTGIPRSALALLQEADTEGGDPNLGHGSEAISMGRLRGGGLGEGSGYVIAKDCGSAVQALQANSLGIGGDLGHSQGLSGNAARGPLGELGGKMGVLGYPIELHTPSTDRVATPQGQDDEELASHRSRERQEVQGIVPGVSCSGYKVSVERGHTDLSVSAIHEESFKHFHAIVDLNNLPQGLPGAVPPIRYDSAVAPDPAHKPLVGGDSSRPEEAGMAMALDLLELALQRGVLAGPADERQQSSKGYSNRYG